MMVAADPFETSCISIRLKSVISQNLAIFSSNSNFINTLVYLFMTNNVEYFCFYGRAGLISFSKYIYLTLQFALCWQKIGT